MNGDSVVSVRVCDLLSGLYGAYAYGVVCGVVDDITIPLNHAAPDSVTQEAKDYIIRLAAVLSKQRRRKDGTVRVPRVQEARA